MGKTSEVYDLATELKTKSLLDRIGGILATWENLYGMEVAFSFNDDNVFFRNINTDIEIPLNRTLLIEKSSIQLASTIFRVLYEITKKEADARPGASENISRIEGIAAARNAMNLGVNSPDLCFTADVVYFQAGDRKSKEISREGLEKLPIFNLACVIIKLINEIHD